MSAHTQAPEPVDCDRPRYHVYPNGIRVRVCPDCLRYNGRVARLGGVCPSCEDSAHLNGIRLERIQS